MKVAEIKKKSKSELKKLLNESKDKLRLLRFDLSAGKVKNVREIREVRKRIARILTILKEVK
ncbi:MAG: 50S ribosomal protein L29 [Patescibacteria group bacterium]|nr:50S ribosomal protein L29 [Patescibacteria group bacterium]